MIITTTGKVSKDGRKVFKDLSASGKIHPRYIEGIPAVEHALEKLINNAILKTVME